MKSIKNLLPKRTKKSNKTDGGKVLIIGGGKGLYGAGILSALAATRSGAGYTHLMTDLASFPWVNFPDFIVHPIKLKELKNKEEFSIGIGPGLGINNLSKKLVQYFIKNNFQNIIADADALTVIAKFNLNPLPTSWILTPHEGELARLLKIKSSLVAKDREKYLKMAVEKFQCCILLKGNVTLILNPSLKKTLKVTSGTPALSKAGTGDVLLGIITAFKAQGLNSEESCFLGTTIHGACSKQWTEEGQDNLSLRPTDLIDRLPKVITRLRKDSMS
jgi:NAD(P)H-hydrate epimerase